MQIWTIEDQENVVRAARLSANFLAILAGLWLIEDISLLWFNLTQVNALINLAMLLVLIIFLRKFWREPKLMSYGWRMRELCGDFQDEYLRSRFQSATTLAFQLMMMAAFFGFLIADLVIKHGDPSLISHKMVPLLTIFVGNLSFYLSLRNVLDDQDDTAEESQ